MKLKKGQKAALELLQSGKNVFLSGEAGTGKSFVLNEFLKRQTKKNVIVAAPTGIAAIQIGGSTLHRLFKIPLEPISPFREPEKIPEEIEKADIIVIDEISMCRFDIFEFVAKSIKSAERTSKRKKQVIVVGDFFQLPPVITDKDRDVLEQFWDEVGEGYAFQAPMWEKFEFVTLVLDEVVRQQGDIDFVTNLNKIRKGDTSAINWFNENSANSPQKGISLCGTNKKAEEINVARANEVSGQERVYKADISGIVNQSDKITSDTLKLKVGMQVMALINDAEGKYQNGSLGTIKMLKTDSVEVLFGGKTVTVATHEWEVIAYKIDENEPTKVRKEVIGRFVQLPLKIAYGITIHKSQGQTYDAANISPACFAPGQLYVALSRVKSIKNLYLTSKIKKEWLITSQDVLDFYEKNKTKIDFVTESIPEQAAEPIIEIVTKSKGGTRDGAGRKKKFGVETCTIRIPKSAKEAVLEFLTSREWE